MEWIRVLKNVLFTSGKLRLMIWLLMMTFQLPACENSTERKKGNRKIDYIREIPGIDDSIPPELVERGEVLISYSDCYTCHKKDRKSVGPAFTDIAKRYPANKVYIGMLAQKVIVGGSGSWGTPVMDPHPNVPLEDAKAMVTYILSMNDTLANH